METRDFETILVAQDGHIATITLNRPEKKNPLSLQMINELLWALDDADEDPEVRVVVLTGAGNAFSAGGDLKGMTAERGGLAKKGEFNDLLPRLNRMSKPVIARIPGYAMGGATGVVACCHFAVACESAILGTPEIKRGLFPMMIMAVLKRVVARRDLLRMMLLGEKLTAAQAQELGLVTEVVPDDALDARVAELAGQLAKMSPTAMRMGLAAFNGQEYLPVDEAMPYLRDQLYALIKTEDAQEGLQAFFQKREPVWKGR